MDECNRWLTVRETAHLLRLSERMVYKLLATGVLASVKVGWSRRVPIVAIDAMQRELLRLDAAQCTTAYVGCPELAEQLQRRSTDRP